MKILFRVDADEKIGMGHLTRCLTVATSLRKLETESCFVVSNEKAKEIVEQKRFEVQQISVENAGFAVKDAEVLKDIAEDAQVDTVVVDSYAITEEYLKVLRCWTKVVVFSCKEEKLPTDVLINYNINCNQEKITEVYRGESTKLLLGSKYVPLRDEFRDQKYVFSENVKNMLVMTGGADMYNFIGNFLKKMKEWKRNENITINCLIGKYNMNREVVEKLASQMRNVHIIEGTDDMASLLKRQDLIVSAGGTTMYEICAVGVPTVLYSIADNQISESIYIRDIGAMEYVGCLQENGFWKKLTETTNDLIANLEKRKRQVLVMNELVDCRGAERIAKSIAELEWM